MGVINLFLDRFTNTEPDSAMPDDRQELEATRKKMLDNNSNKPMMFSKKPTLLSKKPALLSKKPILHSNKPILLLKKPILLSKQLTLLSKSLHCSQTILHCSQEAQAYPFNERHGKTSDSPQSCTREPSIPRKECWTAMEQGVRPPSLL